MQRFEKLWEGLDARLRAGGVFNNIVPTMPDEDVLGLLAGAPEKRRLERNLLATEALNRASRTRRAIVQVADSLRDDVRQLHEFVSDSIARQAVLDLDGTPGAAERKLVRKAMAEHLRSVGVMSALEAAGKRLAEMRDESLARTRHPEIYAVA